MTLNYRHVGLRNRNFNLLIICLISPLIFSIIRKVVPGQPVYLEIGGSGIVALVAIYFFFAKTEHFPSYLGNPLIFWACLQSMYVFFSISTDIRIGLTAFMTRVVPMSMAYIGYAAIRDRLNFPRLSKILCGVAIILFPIGVFAAFFGNEALPIWLRPIISFTESDKKLRAGIEVVSVIFSTGNVLSMSALAIFYLSLANIMYSNQYRLKSTNIWYLSLGASLSLIFVSTRRGALFAALIGFAYYLIIKNKSGLMKTFIIIVLSCATFAGIIILDFYGIFEKSSVQNRLELVVVSLNIMTRIDKIFLGFLFGWLGKAPFGHFLGFGGPEAAAFGLRPDRAYGLPIEVGAAQLSAEMGYIGAFLLPTILATIGYRLYRSSRRLSVHKTVAILLLFQLTFFALYYMKELSCMNGVTIAQLFFWGAFGISGALIRNAKTDKTRLNL